jgi:hypothetical protein
MTRWREIEYEAFWDLPRIICVGDGDRSYLLDCPFDEKLDDYPTQFSVYLMPKLSGAARWEPKHALRCLGSVAIPFSALDPSRRKQIDLDVLAPLIDEGRL